MYLFFQNASATNTAKHETAKVLKKMFRTSRKDEKRSCDGFDQLRSKNFYYV